MESKTHLSDEECFFDTLPYVIAQAFNKDADSLANEAVKLAGGLCMGVLGGGELRFQEMDLWVVEEWEDTVPTYVLVMAIIV